MIDVLVCRRRETRDLWAMITGPLVAYRAMATAAVPQFRPSAMATQWLVSLNGTEKTSTALLTDTGSVFEGPKAKTSAKEASCLLDCGGGYEPHGIYRAEPQYQGHNPNSNLITELLSSES